MMQYRRSFLQTGTCVHAKQKFTATVEQCKFNVVHVIEEQSKLIRDNGPVRQDSRPKSGMRAVEVGCKNLRFSEIILKI